MVAAVVAASVALLSLVLAAAVCRRALRRRGLRTRLVDGVSSSATSAGASESATPMNDEEATTAGGPSASKTMRASARTAAEVSAEIELEDVLEEGVRCGHARPDDTAGGSETSRSSARMVRL